MTVLTGRAALPLAGRTALVTGGGNGLGAAIASSLHRAGAGVVIAGRDTAKLALAAERIGEGVRIAQVDVSDAASVDALAAELGDDEISILVNNAGVGGPVAPLTDISEREWDEVFDINVKGVFLMCRAFLPAMVERRSGDVINLASVTGKRPLVRRTPYAASKMAVIGITTTLAFEVGPLGVSVNTLSPGPVDGPRMHGNFEREAARTGVSYDQAQHDFVSRAALNRMVTEEEVGQAVVAMLQMPGLCGSDVDLSAGMIA